jgi:mannose-6-phosphate isomerase-like protein (cupin superfamily)
MNEYTGKDSDAIYVIAEGSGEIDVKGRSL